MPSIKDNSSEASGLIMESLAAKEPVVVATVAQPEVGQPRAEKTVGVIYAGTVCKLCGGMMIRTGTCLTCRQCGEANGGVPRLTPF